MEVTSMQEGFVIIMGMMVATENRERCSTYRVVSRVLYWKRFPSISVIRLLRRFLKRKRGSIVENGKFHAIFTHLLQCLKLREILERIRFNGGNKVMVQISRNR